ncbi:MAG TPA: hypothetical protein VN832_03735 [Stellaceae bacterium]|nr:hypothetical protein [Stellaceae bacterium]
MEKTEPDEYSDEEAEGRFKEAIRRAVTTPHKPQREMAGKTPTPQGAAQRRRRAKDSPKS